MKDDNMTIQVLLAGTAEPSMLLVDDVNNESLLIPIDEVVDVINKMNKIHHAETYDRMSDDDKKALEAEIDEDHRKRTARNRE
jgi:hypothetical protein